jgi:hypothetical protein
MMLSDEKANKCDKEEERQRKKYTKEENIKE